MSRFSVVKNHPSLLWLVAAGLLILAPVLISMILFIFTLEIVAAGLSWQAAFAFSALFSIIALLATTFWQALLLNGVKYAHKKQFSLLDAFKGVRVLFARTTLLFVITIAWVLLLSTPLLYIESLGIEILLGLALLVTPFVFLKTPVLLHENSVVTSLQLSAKQTFSRMRVVEWAWVKSFSLIAIAVLILGAYSLLAEIQSIGQMIRVVLSFLSLSWFAVLSPVFGFLLVLGGNGIPHVAVLFVLSLLLHFSYVVILSKN